MGEDSSRRSAILKAAERLMRHYGPIKTTVADIAREAGIGVGTVYLEFDSKDAILIEIASAHHGALLTRMEAAALQAGPHAGARLRAALNARLRALLALSAQGDHAPELVHCGCRAVESAWERFLALELALFAQLIRDGVARGELRPLDAEPTARALLRAYLSFTPPHVFASCHNTLSHEIEVMHDLVLQGLVVRGGPPPP